MTEDMVGDVVTIEIDKTFAEIAKKYRRCAFSKVGGAK
jgi:hypothetical protein